MLLGDLNLGPDDVAPVLATAGLERLDGPPSYPAERPERAIDHVAVRGLVAAAPLDAPATPMSDHRPVVADLRLAVAAP